MPMEIQWQFFFELTNEATVVAESIGDYTLAELASEAALAGPIHDERAAGQKTQRGPGFLEFVSDSVSGNAPSEHVAENIVFMRAASCSTFGS